MSHYHKATFNPSSHEREKVREIFPQYLEENAENLISFIEEYYTYLNRDGYPSYELEHIISENDIDATSAKYLDAIQNEIAKIVPQSRVVDRNTLYARIVHFYKTKGTIESVNTFFKLFFDDDPSVYTPGQDLLKLSSGNFVIDTKHWITSNVLHRSTRDELFTDSGLSIGVLNQPIFGKDFEINFTAQLSSTQPASRTYLLSTKNPLANPYVTISGTTELHGPGTIDIFKDSTGTGILFQQSESRKVTTLNSSESAIAYLSGDDDIYDDKWHNISLSYKENDDDITLEVSGSDIVVSESGDVGVDGTYFPEASTGNFIKTGTVTEVVVSGEGASAGGIYNGTYVYDSTEEVWYNTTNTSATVGYQGYFYFNATASRWQFANSAVAAKTIADTAIYAFLNPSMSEATGFWTVDTNSNWTSSGGSGTGFADSAEDMSFATDALKTGWYRSLENSGKAFSVRSDNLITGEQYMVSSQGLTSLQDWDTIGAASANPSAGDTFTYNGATGNQYLTVAAHGFVEHYVKHWHYREYTSATAYTVKFRHALVDDLHVGSGATVTVAYRALEGEADITRQGGSSGTPRADIASIVKLPFINAVTGESKQTATIVVKVDNVEKLRTNIPNNGGYSLATESLSIFSKNRSANTSNDTRGSITAFSVENAFSNGFDYRFTKSDALSLSTLVDFSPNSNTGNITLNTSGSDYTSATAPTVTEIASFTLLNFLPGLDSPNGVYTKSGTGIAETWTGPNGHKFVIEAEGGVYNWRFYDVDDNNPNIVSSVNAAGATTLAKPWEIVTEWNPFLPPSTVLEVNIQDKWKWSDSATSLGVKPSNYQPLPTVESYKDDTNGFLSSDKKIQDSEFWQDFSYEIRTKIEGSKWKDSFNRLVHPAGLKFFVKLLLESSATGNWDKVETYIGSFENEDAWLFNLLPPALRTLNSYEGTHTPRYQPGWLSSLISLFVQAFANISQRGFFNGVNYRDGQDIASSSFVNKLRIPSNNVELKNNYANGIVQEPVNSSLRKFATFTKVLNGFTATSGSLGSGFSFAGFPLSQPMRAGDSIKIGYSFTRGSGTNKTYVGLLKGANDIGRFGEISINTNSPSTYFTSNTSLLVNASDGVKEITLTAIEDGCRFVGFLVNNTDAASQLIQITDFTVITPPGESTYDYYRNSRQIATSEVVPTTSPVDPPQSRAEYVYNSYLGTPTRNPDFWIDPREMRRTGYLENEIGNFVLDFDAALASTEYNRAGLSNPHSSIITVPGIEESGGNENGNERIEFFGRGGPLSEGGYDNIVHLNVTVVDVNEDINFSGDESGIAVSGSQFLALNRTYTKVSDTLWTNTAGSSNKTLAFGNVSGLTTYGPSEIIDGQEYEIVTLGTTNWTTYGADANPAYGEIFTAANSVNNDITTGKVKHRPKVWHLNDLSGPYVRYVDANVDTYHESGAAKGSNRQGVVAAADIINLNWINHATGTSADNKFAINGNQTFDFKFHQGTKYIFDVSDSSNSGHPMRFSLTNSTTMLDSKYISTNGTEGSHGSDGTPATVTLTARFDNGFGTDIYMYCKNHGEGMGSLYNPILEQT